MGCTWAVSCSKRGLFLVAVHRLLVAAASLVAEHQLYVCGLRELQHVGSVVAVPGLNWSTACGIFPDQRSNPCSLHWQADLYPLDHQGSPMVVQF